MTHFLFASRMFFVKFRRSLKDVLRTDHTYKNIKILYSVKERKLRLIPKHNLSNEAHEIN